VARTQKQIIDAISKELDMPIRLGRTFFQEIVQQFTAELVKQGRMEMAGLGTFAVQVRPKHNTIHPTTGLQVTVPTRRTVRYRSARQLRRKLNAPKDPET
jgi:nucleoid DNA-binding protein